MYVWPALAPQADLKDLKTPVSFFQAKQTKESHFYSSNRGRVCAQDLCWRPQRCCWLQSEPIGPLKHARAHTRGRTHTEPWQVVALHCSSWSSQTWLFSSAIATPGIPSCSPQTIPPVTAEVIHCGGSCDLSTSALSVLFMCGSMRAL